MSNIDWSAMMRAGLHSLQLHPEQFWRMSPAELALMLGVGPQNKPLGRERLEDLLRLFPDERREEDEDDG